MTHWETWDWRIKYVPLIPVWLWHCIKARSFWFFTPSNPSLVFGGFDGVSKKDMYSHLPEHSYPKSIFITKDISFEQVKEHYETNGFQYPIAVKPEIGRMGFMFRKIDSEEELKKYHTRMPVSYILQEFVQYPIEVSVFYYRFPGEKNGTITGFRRKDSLQVIGDGRSYLLELIHNSPRACLWLDELKAKHREHLHTILVKGEVFNLSHALNLSRGGKLVNIDHEKDEKLLQVFDDLSHHSKHFYYGRYDIKCASVEDLKNKKNFKILEYNGSGGEPHHVYGNGNTLAKACWILSQHWNIMSKIARANNKNGIEYWKPAEGWKFFREANKHVQLLKRLDSEFPV